MIVQEDPSGIVETADSFVINATAEVFNLTMKGINAGRDDLSNWWFSNDNLLKLNFKNHLKNHLTLPILTNLQKWVVELEILGYVST